MNVLGQYLDERDDRRRDQDTADDLWLRQRAGIDSAARLISWDRWLYRRLADALQWPENADSKARLIRQCAAEITVLAKELRGRGWLLDGKALAAHVDAILQPIAKAQKAGRVGDFWPYFRASVRRYVGLNAEEIQQHARRVGADEAAAMIGAILSEIGGVGVPSMVELLVDRAGEIAEAKAETLRAKQARLRAVRKADAQQQQLL